VNHSTFHPRRWMCGGQVVPIPAFPFGNELCAGMEIVDGISKDRSQKGAFPSLLLFLEIVDVYCNSHVPGVPLLRREHFLRSASPRRRRQRAVFLVLLTKPGAAPKWMPRTHCPAALWGAR
jgi:hypothetical protein